jgi:hypothetical protein
MISKKNSFLVQNTVVGHIQLKKLQKKGERPNIIGFGEILKNIQQTRTYHK